MKRYYRAAAVCLLAALLAATAADGGKEAYTEASQADVRSGKNEKRELYCTILGDSIARGYSEEKEVLIECYGRIAAKKEALAEGRRYKIRNFAVDGMDTEKLNTVVLSQEQVLQSLEKSELIFISIGSNDLLGVFRDAAGQSLGGRKFTNTEQALDALSEEAKKNPLLILRVIKILEDWDSGTFEKEWNNMMAGVTDVKREEAQVVVNNIYNPASGMSLPASVKRTAEDIIDRMNAIIDRCSHKYGYSVADLYSSDVAEHVQGDGVHPNQEGQEIIAEIVLNCL